MLLKRLRIGGRLSKITVEMREGFDDRQGIPVYGDPVEIDARVVREDRETLSTEGDYIRTQLSLWILPDEQAVPREGDRVTYADEAFIGAESKEVKAVNGELAHTRTRCRRE